MKSSWIKSLARFMILTLTARNIFPRICFGPNLKRSGSWIERLSIFVRTGIDVLCIATCSTWKIRLCATTLFEHTLDNPLIEHRISNFFSQIFFKSHQLVRCPRLNFHLLFPFNLFIFREILFVLNGLCFPKKFYIFNGRKWFHLRFELHIYCPQFKLKFNYRVSASCLLYICKHWSFRLVDIGWVGVKQRIIWIDCNICCQCSVFGVHRLSYQFNVCVIG